MDRYRVFRGDGCAYLCTCAFIRWLPVFNCGEQYFRIVTDSLGFCRRKKGLILNAYVLMPDHLHLIVQDADISGIMRDFKTWTSRQISAELERDGRAEIISLMRTDALEADGGEFRVWQPGFHPKAITSDAMMLQKLEYVHQNPVRKGFVRAAEDWRYSSAGDYLTDRRGEMEIDRLRPLIV